MKLEELFKEISYEIVNGGDDKGVSAMQTEVKELVNDSRKLQEGCLFLCIRGSNFDGHTKAFEAFARKAAAIVVEEEVEIPKNTQTVVIRVKDTRYAMAFIAAAFYSHPAKELMTIGITGTKGKTTTTYLVKSMLENAGIQTGLIGTIEMIIGEEHFPASNTTPESLSLQRDFRRMADAGMKAVVMEVSSQALMMHRTQGFLFDMGIFTNIEPDHIGPNEHKDFAEYMHCKGLLFQQCKHGIVNADDEHLPQILKGHTCDLTTFGLGDGADLKAEALAYMHKPGELGVYFDTKGIVNMHAEIAMPGKFSVYNALCAIAVAHRMGCRVEEMEEALKKVRVRGRIEMVKVSDDYTLMIDYAHNAMALHSLLTTLRYYRPNRLICLFGCGGNRSRERRFEMGEVSGKLADLTIITSDNPRFEDPMEIIRDIETGIQKTDGHYVEIPDRKEAIRYAMAQGERGDIIILAGKGHEDYQEIRGVKYPMDERVLIHEILQENQQAQQKQ